MTDPRRLATLGALLDEVLELDPGQRDARLAELRRDQPALAAELDRLLANEPRLSSRGFMEQGISAPTDAPLEGAQVGVYRLVKPLGRGGMGTVWLAERGDGRFDARYAIKLLNLALLDSVGRERFRREGQVLARLTHPNIAGLIDAGVTDAGVPYLVLEHVDGLRIDRYCDENRLDPLRRIRLFEQVLAAVAHAHGHLVVHRDLKASNILVTRDGTVKLLDFGVAKLLEANTEAGERTDLTARGGGLAFTPEYAAPEQVAGGVITTATDVYALGVLLYLLLAGRHPTAPGQPSPVEHLRAVVDTKPPRLSAAAAVAAAAAPEVARARASNRARLSRSYRGDLDNILAKALRKLPADRYQTAAALHDDLHRFRRMEPVSARADSVWYRTGRFFRRNRLAVSFGAAAGLALVATTGFSVAQMKEAQSQRDAALYQTRRAEAQSEFQTLLMSQVGEEPMTMREIVDHGGEVLEQQYEGDPRFLGSMVLQLSRRYAELGDSPEHWRYLARAESLAAAGGTASERVEIRCDVANYLRTQGEYDSAYAVLAEADSMRRHLRDPVVDEWCLQMRAYLASEAGDPAQAREAIQQALTLIERAGRSGESEYFEALALLAAVLDSEGRYREAIAVHARVIAALDSSGRRKTMVRNISMHNQALTLVELGETREAERRFHEVLLLAAGSDPSGHVHPQPLIHYAEGALSQGLADSAAKYFAQLIAQAERDSSRYWQGRGTFGLVRAQARLGRLDDARITAARFRDLRHGFPRLLSTDDQVPDTLAVAGWLALAEGDTAAAYEWFMASLRTNGFFDGKQQKKQGAVALHAAEAAIVLGREDSAFTLAGQALSIARRDSLTETRSAKVGEARLVQGKALLARGDTSAATASIERAVVALLAGAGPGHPRTIEARALRARLSGGRTAAVPAPAPGSQAAVHPVPPRVPRR